MAVCPKCNYPGPFFCYKCGSTLRIDRGFFVNGFECSSCGAKGPQAYCNKCNAVVHA